MVSRNDRIAGVFSRCIFVLLLFASMPAMSFAADGTATTGESNNDSQSSHLYKVEILRGHRRTISGTKRSYTLYLPQPAAGLPGPPYPMLVIAHGFLMSGTQQSSNSYYFAERGIAVLSPNLTRIMWGDKNRLRNVKDVIDQISWVTKQSKSKKSAIYGLIDANRVGTAGNSSGGAVALETVIQAQKSKVPIRAFCSMDGAPWDRSWEPMSKLAPLKVFSLRAEPSICNEHARMLNFLRRMQFSFDDIKIIGAHHCDAENPTTLRCMCICGRSRSQYRELFQLFTYLFFRDAFGVAPLAAPTKKLVDVASDLEAQGKIIVRLNQEGSKTACGIHDKPEDE
jgi:hypothetical protein